MSNSSWPFPTEQLPLPEVDLSVEDLQIALSNINMPTYTYSSTAPSGNVTIGASNWTTTGASNTAFGYTTAGSNGTWGNVTQSNVLDVRGDDADVVINGKSLSKFMETMESRLAILQPDLEKLEHFSALKKAYDHYKALEALCELPTKENDT